MKILIAGPGRLLETVISQLEGKGHSLIAMCGDRTCCHHLAQSRDILVINENPCDTAVLDSVGIRNLDILIAVFDEDCQNLIICQSFKKLFGNIKTMCTVSSPANSQLFIKLGIDRIWCAPVAIANEALSFS